MKILITESKDFSQKALEMLTVNNEVVISDIKDKENLIESIKDVEVIFIRLRFNFDQAVLQHAKKLKYILSPTTGLDHIDIEYFNKCGGQVVSLKGETEFLNNIPSTAEHTWALLLTLFKKIPSSFEHVKKGYWNRDLFKGNNLRNKKIGILGLGRVGKQVAKFADVFGMEIQYFDIKNVESEYKKVNSPEELFLNSDVVTIHIPYDSENHNYVDEKLLSRCKKGIILINTSRGGIWDEDYVAKLIHQNRIGGLATDVLKDELNGEKRISNPLVKLASGNDNIIITPHIAGATFESMNLTEEFIVSKFINLVSSEK
ncbi:NAD(P)-binding domain-containing protein [Flavobacterium amniphilum]|uniref:NAD(P)-dependent oxidoreductase n=1 Tax=Flavobacterium amniphilum TaxID=1834035 RepID=UPI00202A06A4|nr:NAD(P)-dependent oxidoreductase [Flavobacterium amniphilum]MCL9805102.1 NAD(P)-binding domain-containing protein [Flavobacterium amniphilum]